MSIEGERFELGLYIEELQNILAIIVEKALAARTEKGTTIQTSVPHERSSGGCIVLGRKEGQPLVWQASVRNHPVR